MAQETETRTEEQVQQTDSEKPKEPTTAKIFIKKDASGVNPIVGGIINLTHADLDDTVKDIELHLKARPSGAFEAFDLHDAIAQTKKLVTVQAGGLVTATQVLVMQAADFRMLPENAWINFNDLLSGKGRAFAEDMGTLAENFLGIERAAREIILSRTNLSIDDMMDFFKKPKLMSSYKAQEIGLIDVVLETNKFNPITQPGEVDGTSV